MPTHSEYTARLSPTSLDATTHTLTICPPDLSGQTELSHSALPPPRDPNGHLPSSQANTHVDNDYAPENVDHKVSVDNEMMDNEQFVNEEEASGSLTTIPHVPDKHALSALTMHPTYVNDSMSASAASHTLEFSGVRVRQRFLIPAMLRH